MLQSSLAATSGGLPRHNPLIEFYSVELTPLADGHVFVGVSATVCEPVRDDDFELVNMQMASERVATIDEALAVIREAVVPAH